MSKEDETREVEYTPSIETTNIQAAEPEQPLTDIALTTLQSSSPSSEPLMDIALTMVQTSPSETSRSSSTQPLMDIALTILQKSPPETDNVQSDNLTSQESQLQPSKTNILPSSDSNEENPQPKQNRIQEKIQILLNKMNIILLKKYCKESTQSDPNIKIIGLSPINKECVLYDISNNKIIDNINDYKKPALLP